MSRFIHRIYGLGITFALIMALTTFITHRHHENVFIREVERTIELKLDNIVTQIRTELQDVEKVLDAGEIAVRLDVDDHDQILTFFRQLVAKNETLIALYLGTPDGVSLYVNGKQPPPGVDVRTRPWYNAAVAEGGVIFTAPYVDLVDDRLVMTMAQPIYENGELLGVIGLDTSLETIVSLLDREKVSESGASFFFTQSGEIIVQSGQELSSEPYNLCTVADCDFFLEPQGLRSIAWQGKEGYLRWESLENLQLMIGAFVPYEEVMNRQAMNVQMVATVFLSSVFIFYLLFVFQRRYIVQPIRDLDRDIMSIPVDDFAYRLPILSHHAFPALRATINQTLAKTQEQFENVMHQQEELEATYAQLVTHERQLQKQYDEIKQHEAHIQYLADHDSLTGLLNRRKFEEDVEKTLNAGGAGAILLLDIDNFKVINDTQGHVFGDQVLQFVAGVLRVNPRQEVKAYHFGADKFLVHLAGVNEEEEVIRTIHALRSSMYGIRVINGKRTHVTASIGVALYPQDGESVDELLIKVDIALHNAKNKGKNRFLFFQEDMADTFSQRVQLEQMLVEAQQAGNFKLVYQPIVSVATGEIAYLEALIRIRGNEGVSPEVFISIAEESNLILPIGRWVIEEAISQIVKWRRAGKPVRPVSINLSTKQFYDDGLVDFLERQLTRYDLEPTLLEMEITETVLIGNPEEALEIINRIRNLGVRIALDDFGTGYSSINYITRMPVDRIKLERHMTQKLGENIAVMEGLIAIAHGLDMDVVGEGVETEEEARLLIEVGCDFLQGYLFSHPVEPSEAEKLMEMDYSELLGIDP